MANVTCLSLLSSFGSLQKSGQGCTSIGLLAHSVNIWLSAKESGQGWTKIGLLAHTVYISLFTKEWLFSCPHCLHLALSGRGGQTCHLFFSNPRNVISIWLSPWRKRSKLHQDLSLCLCHLHLAPYQRECTVLHQGWFCSHCQHVAPSRELSVQSCAMISPLVRAIYIQPSAEESVYSCTMIYTLVHAIYILSPPKESV